MQSTLARSRLSPGQAPLGACMLGDSGGGGVATLLSKPGWAVGPGGRQWDVIAGRIKISEMSLGGGSEVKDGGAWDRQEGWAPVPTT